MREKNMSAPLCYIDHATGESDHMNAHVQTISCLHRCDACGAPATSLARDIRDVTDGEWMKFEPTGPLKKGCDRHPARSLEHRKDGSVVAVTDDLGRPIPRT